MIPAKAVLATYLVATHVVIGALVWRGHFIERAVAHFRRDTRPAMSEGYEEAMRSGVLRSQQMKGSIAFIGDSRIAWLATSNVADDSENFGIVGDDLERCAYRLRRMDLSKAAVAILAVGLNERQRDFAGFEVGYRAVLRAIPAGVPVVASAILPVNPEQNAAFLQAKTSSWSDTPQRLQSVNATIKRLCAAREKCAFFDGSPTVQSGKDRLRDDMSMDGVHLNAKGNAAWGYNLRSFLSRNYWTLVPRK